MENQNWLENTIEKIGNEIEIQPIGYKKLDGNKYELEIKVSNKGLSDQVYKNIPIRFPENMLI